MAIVQVPEETILQLAATERPVADTNHPKCEYCGHPLKIITKPDGSREVEECSNPNCPSNAVTSQNLLPNSK